MPIKTIEDNKQTTNQQQKDNNKKTDQPNKRTFLKRVNLTLIFRQKETREYFFILSFLFQSLDCMSQKRENR
jgi:hypothetical protein